MTQRPGKQRDRAVEGASTLRGSAEPEYGASELSEGWA